MKQTTKFLLTGTALLMLMAATLYAEDATSSDDDLFGDDTIVDASGNSAENTSPADANTTSTGSTLKTADSAHGIIFQNGSVKVGGTFTMSAYTLTTLYDDSDNSFKDNVYNSAIVPTATGELTVDARPSQTLRMFTKFGMKYPYAINAYTVTNTQLLPTLPETALSLSSTAIVNSFYVKELFTDFSLKDRAFFRFGLHTVTWGTGYFFSPVSDMINTTAIDPENPTAQVNGALNLRTQITFADTQNCIWAYVIPDTTLNMQTYAYDARKTALAVKGDILLGDWELGLGCFYKYQNAPKAMITASGSIINNKVSVFAEGVYAYGSKQEWNADSSWTDKTNVFEATAGASYYWKTPQITFAAQYLYDSNSDDDAYTTKGHNVAGTVSFGKIGTTDVTANVYGIFYLGKDKNMAAANQYAGIAAASISYAPISELTMSAGPYVTWTALSDKPTVALKIAATFGGGKF